MGSFAEAYVFTEDGDRLSVLEDVNEIEEYNFSWCEFGNQTVISMHHEPNPDGSVTVMLEHPVTTHKLKLTPMIPGEHKVIAFKGTVDSSLAGQKIHVIHHAENHERIEVDW